MKDSQKIANFIESQEKYFNLQNKCILTLVSNSNITSCIMRYEDLSKLVESENKLVIDRIRSESDRESKLITDFIVKNVQVKSQIKNQLKQKNTVEINQDSKVLAIFKMTEK